jgi:hypothetical protein
MSMSNQPPQGSSNGPPSAGIGMQHPQGGGGGGAGGSGHGQPPPSQNLSQQNLNQIVSSLSVRLQITCFISIVKEVTTKTRSIFDLNPDLLKSN